MVRVTYHDIIRLQLEGVGLEPLRTKSLLVDEGTVRAFDILDEDLYARKIHK